MAYGYLAFPELETMKGGMGEKPAMFPKQTPGYCPTHTASRLRRAFNIKTGQKYFWIRRMILSKYIFNLNNSCSDIIKINN
jgi:hypothetical protein